MSDNQREFPRYDTDIKVVVVDEDNHEHTASVTNVSAGGAVGASPPLGPPLAPRRGVSDAGARGVLIRPTIPPIGHRGGS